MARQRPVARDSGPSAASVVLGAMSLKALIRERIGDQQYGIFHNVGEGTFFPDGSEDCSGFVVTEDGAHYFYWTDWQDGRKTFGTWESELFQEEWTDSSEYLQARQSAGLPILSDAEAV